MGILETSREPCPDRILDRVGSGFATGAVGGSVFHFLKGRHSSPRGERLRGGVQAIRMNAGRVSGELAVCGGVFSALDCSMVFLRKKEDPWNAIVAGAATGALMHMPQGLAPASRGALFGGAVLALIEGAAIMINRIMPQPHHIVMDD